MPKMLVTPPPNGSFLRQTFYWHLNSAGHISIFQLLDHTHLYEILLAVRH